MTPPKCVASYLLAVQLSPQYYSPPPTAWEWSQFYYKVRDLRIDSSLVVFHLYTKRVTATLRTMCDEKTLREIFDHFDADKSGSIDKKELKSVLKAYFEAVGEAADDKKVDDATAVSHCILLVPVY